MNTAEAIRIALHSLWANKLRSVLTLLGIVIGIAAVIAVVTFVSGLNAYVAEQVFNLGADVFIVNKVPNVITNVDQWLEMQKRKNLEMDDYKAVREACRYCEYVGVSAYYGNGHIRYEDQSSSDTGVRGWTWTMNYIYDLETVAGRSFVPSDDDNASSVVIIGYDIYDKLMGGVGDPIGKEIRIDGQLYRVIGLGKKEGKVLGQSRDNWVALPITTWMRQYGSHQNIRIWGKAYGIGALLDNAMDETRAILRARRHDALGKPDSFEIDTNDTFIGLWSALSGNFFLVMIVIASVSLIVGGIVIMNIMLVSVTERTREIGIRKALGARRNDVLRQFLIESCTMALVGGIIGVLLGIGVAKAVTFFVGMPSEIRLWAVLAGLFMAASVGIFFGVYPARRAAMLDPIAALRFEL